MPRPTYPVKRICYADDISVWASGAEIPELEVKIKGYLKEMSEFLKSNSLLISAPKSTVTLFAPDTQAKYHPRHQDSWISTSTEPQPEDLRGPPGHILNFKRTLQTSGNNISISNHICERILLITEPEPETTS